MKRINWPLMLALSLLAGLVAGATGCASRNVNPPTAKAGLGYVDFYIAATVPLCWEVTSLDDQGWPDSTLFSDFDPIHGNTLRLALDPGAYRMQITYLNRAILSPAIVDVLVQPGMITPVEVLYEPAQTVHVREGAETLKRTVRGVMRSTEVSIGSAMTFRLAAEVHDAVPYLVKERTPYYQ